MRGCLDCGFAWNAAFEPNLLVYDGSYENDQTCSTTFREHVASRARRVADVLSDLQEPRLVEVGCGQGTFFKIMEETLGALPGPATGFDPAWRGKDGDGPATARLFRTYLNRSTASLADGCPDAVISRHTIEHVPDPKAFLSEIRAASACNKAVRLFIETPCVNWILDNGQVQDLFYEHCSLFTDANLAKIIEQAGFGPASVEHVFDGQYLWAEVRPGSKRSAPARIPDFNKWQSKKRDYIEQWRQIVIDASDRGSVYLWGAGSKGVTFSLLIDPDGELLDGAVDINPMKQDCFLPLTALPVVPPERLPTSGATVIVMNPTYHTEIVTKARTMGRDLHFLSVTA
jgi:hypothetical protein